MELQQSDGRDLGRNIRQRGSEGEEGLSNPSHDTQTETTLRSRVVSVAWRAALATAVATVSAISLFLSSRYYFQAPYDWLNLTEAVVIPILVGFPICAFIFYQNDRLARAKVALAQQAKDNERQQMLLNELNHRVKNTLATVMALSAQTARRSDDLPAFLAAFNGRLVALAAGHDILSRGGWSNVTLQELIGEVLKPYSSSLRSDGPEVFVRPAAALSLSLVLHELATNAAKYGAFSTDGTVHLRWTVGNTLHFQWMESGGPILSEQPPKSGFGSRLIDQVMQELEGTIRRDFAGEGFRAELSIPIASLQ